MNFLVSQPRLKALLVLAGLLTTLTSRSVPSWAQTAQQTKSHTIDASIHFEPPDRGTPPAKHGIGSRGNCGRQENTPPLTRLAGDNNLELTVSEHPTIWVYVPYTATEAPAGVFSLQDGDTEIYRSNFKLPATPGIISITVPTTTKSLEIDKTYRWYVDIECSASASSAISVPTSLTGVVKRVSITPGLEQQLNAVQTPLRRIAAYAENHIWYETLTELARLRLRQLSDPELEAIWIELLNDQYVGLADVAQEPILGEVVTEDF
ncbi:MAG: DUF928 domain-containing protein [Cyanothece sp. SIO1E1]|nr:DUF928 domain-containing protein [Cyanothece sp. SIO1E1]